MRSTAYFVTGGAGFIGSAMVRHLILRTSARVLTVDKLTYAGSVSNLAPVMDSTRHEFVRADINDRRTMMSLLEAFRPDAVLHLAAESHVDRSIDGPGDFIHTNIVGTHHLLEAALAYWRRLDASAAESFRFIHVSTDEVFGSLGASGLFSETSPYDPRSPYSASKAASDHLARAWYHTFGLPTILTNTCNNYGPYQFPEKLIPLVIQKALRGETIPVYGRGENVRDWIYVDDHVKGIVAACERGLPGETYNLGARCEMSNLDLVTKLCAIVDTLDPRRPVGRSESLIEFVPDRPGHDFRYAIDPSKAETQLGWRAEESIESGLPRTVQWYIENSEWAEALRSRGYQGERLGLSDASHAGG